MPPTIWASSAPPCREVGRRGSYQLGRSTSLSLPCKHAIHEKHANLANHENHPLTRNFASFAWFAGLQRRGLANHQIRSVPMRDIGSAHFGAPFGESECLTVSGLEPATPPRLLERVQPWVCRWAARLTSTAPPQRVSERALASAGAHDSVFEALGALGSPVRSAVPQLRVCYGRVACAVGAHHKDVGVALDAVGGVDDPLTVGRVGG